MALFPDDMPKVDPVWDDREFWEHCRKRELRFQACADCGTPRHPPTPVCGACHSMKVQWIEAPAGAELFSFTRVHYPSHPAVKGNLPYVVGLVVFPDLPGVKLVSNVTDADDVRIGMKLELWWDDAGDGQWLPRFRPAGDD